MLAEITEKVACAAVSPHLYIPSYTYKCCYPPLEQQHSNSDKYYLFLYLAIGYYTAVFLYLAIGYTAVFL